MWSSYNNCQRASYVFVRRISSAAKVKKESQEALLSDITAENQYDKLAECVTPLVNVPYKEQLKLKYNWAKDIVKLIFNTNRKIPAKAVRVHQVIPSPVTEEYRNKDELSVWTGVDGDPKTVGFFIGSPAVGDIVCVPPTRLVNIRPKHVQLAQLYQEFIRASELRACHHLQDGGFWRNLTLRSNRRGDTMAVLSVHPAGASEEGLTTAVAQFAQFFSHRDIKSLFYQACPRIKCPHEFAPFVLLHGHSYIYEELGGYRFRLGPDSFFQVNPDAAELLYSHTLQMLGLSPHTTLLDLCCGTGTFSIFASRQVRGAIGIDLTPGAIKDAEFNASYNKVTNCHFIEGAVEKKLVRVLKELGNSADIATVLNPGRAGVVTSTVKCLRNCPTLNRLAFISCKADSRQVVKNFRDLCDPQFDGSEPFVLSDVQPLDMFPHTSHAELILLFRR